MSESGSATGDAAAGSGGREEGPVLDADQRDRLSGVLVGLACGDALGVPYEFATPPTGEPEMLGGGLGDYQPGEGSDDSQMAVLAAEVAARGTSVGRRPGAPPPGGTGRATLSIDEAVDALASLFLGWALTGPPDIGVQTRAVLADAAARLGMTRERAVVAGAAEACTRAARSWHERTGRSAGNGALMRTAAVGLPFLRHPEVGAATARRVAALTHADWRAAATCVLAGETVRRAVVDGVWQPLAGVDLLLPSERDEAARWVRDAVAGSPDDFADPGFTVRTLQGALAAVSRSRRVADPSGRFSVAVGAAVRAGGDTDTVAAVTGAIAGALDGVEAVPTGWREAVVVRARESGGRVDGRYDARALAALARAAAGLHSDALVEPESDARPAGPAGSAQEQVGNPGEP